MFVLLTKWPEAVLPNHLQCFPGNSNHTVSDIIIERYLTQCVYSFIFWFSKGKQRDQGGGRCKIKEEKKEFFLLCKHPAILL